MTDQESSDAKPNEEREEFTLPMYERVILAFLARATTVRTGDEELVSRLKDLRSQQIAEAILHPNHIPPTLDAGRRAERLLLDAGNFDAAKLLQSHMPPKAGQHGAKKAKWISEPMVASSPVTQADAVSHRRT